MRDGDRFRTFCLFISPAHIHTKCLHISICFFYMEGLELPHLGVVVDEMDEMPALI